jgi:hypothetical protein
MTKVSKADLKKSILAVEAERLKHPARFRPDRNQRTMLRKGRQASEKMLAGFLTAAGLDLKKFKALQEQRSATVERMVAQHKREALRRAAQQKDTLSSSIVAQSHALRDLASRGDFFPNPSFSLDTPFLIWTIPLQAISESAAVPFGSWAKFKFSASDDGEHTQKIGFYFYWVNPYQDYAVINAATFMSATGYLKSHAPWGLGVNASWVQATAILNLWHGWPDAVTSSTSDGEFLGVTDAYSSTFTDLGDTEGVSISSGVSLNTSLFAVPAGSLVVFEVALELDYENDGGDIEADFESGDFQIACPVVVFSLLNSPPGLMA